MSNQNLCGLDSALTVDVASDLKNANSMGYSFIAIDLFHPKVTDVNGDSTHTAITRSDLVFQSEKQNVFRSYVGKISTWIDVDSECVSFKKRSEIALRRELSWACHLGLPAVSIRIRDGNVINFARVLMSHIMEETNYLTYWLVFPLACISNESDMDEAENSPTNSHGDDSWHWWVKISGLMSDVIQNLSICLILPENLPEDYVIDRWLSEPIACIYVPTKLFNMNSKGYPILSKAHQNVLKKFFKLDLQVMITGAAYDDRGYQIYKQYIYWLHKNQKDSSFYQEQSKGLEDQLQEPLQPLKDNLSSATYSIFEMDPYKYKAYEDAIHNALIHRAKKFTMPNGTNDWPALSNGHGNEAATTEDEVSACKQTVMVLGAGRGPLVKAALQASERCGVPIRVYIVEKNPNAVITLLDRIQNEWQNADVHLLPGDMREQMPGHKADIFVSELLGSFGDNELSPECLDGAQKYLKDDGISIPSSYTSYLAPIQSRRIHNETTKMHDFGPIGRVSNPSETPYVVRLLNCQILDKPQEMFTFKHPRQDMDTVTNDRYEKRSFAIEHDCVIHGFAGFFDSVLYGDIHMSIHPDTHSPDMVSWFPIVFPLDKPLTLKGPTTLIVHMWRCVTTKDVWYEWAVSDPVPTRIHNANGKAYKIGL